MPNGRLLLYPLKRAGERGESGRQRLAWDDALADIADAIADAIEGPGPHTVVHEGTREYATVGPTGRSFTTIGGRGIDAQGSFNDCSIGLHETFGKFSAVSSADDRFHSELLLIWHMNPVFTRVSLHHFIAEARYNGTEVVNILPGINASHTCRLSDSDQRCHRCRVRVGYSTGDTGGRAGRLDLHS